MGNYLKMLGDWLDGKKTYAFILLLFIMFMLDIKGLIPAEMQTYKEEIYAILLTGAGISMRMGMGAENKKMEKTLIKEIKKEGDKQ